MTSLNLGDIFPNPCEDLPLVDLYPTPPKVSKPSLLPSTATTTYSSTVQDVTGLTGPRVAPVLQLDANTRSHEPSSTHTILPRNNHQPDNNPSGTSTLKFTTTHPTVTCAVCPLLQTIRGSVTSTSDTVIFDPSRLKCASYFHTYGFFKFMDIHCNSLITDVTYSCPQCKGTILLKSTHHSVSFIVSVMKNYFHSRHSAQTVHNTDF